MKIPKRVRLAAVILFFQATFLTFVFTVGLYVWWLINQAVNEIEAVVDETVRSVGAEFGNEVSAAVVGYVPPAADWPIIGLVIRRLLGVQQFLLPVMMVLAILTVAAFVTSVGVWNKRRWAFLAVIGIAAIYFFFIIPPVGAFFMLFFTIPLVTPKSVKAFWGDSGLNKAALQQVGHSAIQRGGELRDQVVSHESVKQLGSSVREQSENLRGRVQESDSIKQLKRSTRDYADRVGHKLIKDDVQTDESKSTPIETEKSGSNMDHDELDSIISSNPIATDVVDASETQRTTDSSTSNSSLPTDHSGYLS